MTLGANARSAAGSSGFNAKRNFILQQGLCEPVAGTCPIQYSALLFQRRLIGIWLAIATILQAQLMFFALAAVLWWSALVPRFNIFDALYNWILARSRGTSLTPAPAPRRFAQFLAGTFALAIGISLVLGWRTTALVLEGFFIAAVGLLVFGGVLSRFFCLSCPAWAHRLCQANSSLGYGCLTWAPRSRFRSLSK
jgi:hypothetical protein